MLCRKMWQVNKYVQIYGRSRTPLYLQVASVIRQRIETGEWAEGEKISTLEVLEKEFAVARVTVRQAIELLRNEGLLDAQQGRGTFVSGRPEDNRWFNLASDFSSLVESLKKRACCTIAFGNVVMLCFGAFRC